LLVLLILLSPLAIIIAALLFGVSIIALIIRVAQRRLLKGWGIAAVASLVLMVTFGAMSDVLYGTGFMSGESVSLGNMGTEDVAYDVVSIVDNTDGKPNYSVVSSANDLESLNLVAQDIQQQRLQTGQGSVGRGEPRT
jgi:hypothetical protein